MSVREINLLPPDRRRRLRNESVAVSITDIIQSINSGLLLMTLVAGAIVFSIWLFSVAATQTTKEELQTVVAEYQGLRDTVAEKNAVFERVAALGRQRIVWSDILSEFLPATLAGVTLHQLGGDLVFTDGLVSSGTLKLGGQAVTRSTLIKYEEKLRTLSWVADVAAPTSNLLERTNPTWQFNVALNVKK